MRFLALAALFFAAAAFDSPKEVHPLKVGTPAPDAAVWTLEGDAQTLTELRGGDRSVLIFYRGGW